MVSVSDSDSDPDSDPVTSFRTCGLSGKKLNLSNTQKCIGGGEYPQNRQKLNAVIKNEFLPI